MIISQSGNESGVGMVDGCCAIFATHSEKEKKNFEFPVARERKRCELNLFPFIYVKKKKSKIGNT
jgi:hypothetical protein